MQLAGILVEYLIIGAVSLTGFVLLLLSYGVVVSNKLPALALAVPLAYILGMISDFLGQFFLKPFKTRIEKEILGEYGYTPGEFSTGRLHAYLTEFSPRLANEVQLRSTRDRVARGSLVNLPLILGAGLHWSAGQSSGVRAAALMSSIALIVLVIFTWRRFQRYSVKYEMHSLQVLLHVLKEKRIDIASVVRSEGRSEGHLIAEAPVDIASDRTGASKSGDARQH